MTMTTTLDTNQTTIASAGGKLRRRSIPAIRNKKPNLLTKIVNKLFNVVFGNRKPSETNEEPQNVPLEEGQRATPMVTSREEEIASPVELAKAYMASRPYKVARRQDLVLHNNATKIAPKIANGFENGFASPISRGRSVLYRMARPSYARSLTFTQKEKRPGSIKSPTKRTLDILHGQVARSLEKGDSPRLLSYPLNEPPLKLPVEPPHKKRAFRTSVPGSDSALAAHIVATSTLPGVSKTPTVVEPPQKNSSSSSSSEDEEDDDDDDDELQELASTKNNEAMNEEEMMSGSDHNVDKKADEFIAKFREQIRLQRIASIRTTTTTTQAKAKTGPTTR
nr:nuclear pore complex protein NUP1-like isoform X2 [Tanacetum cinerariifolium]